MTEAVYKLLTKPRKIRGQIKKAEAEKQTVNGDAEEATGEAGSKSAKAKTQRSTTKQTILHMYSFP